MATVSCREGDQRRIPIDIALRDAAGYARWQAKLRRLVAMSEAELAAIDIARLNMFCAAGLPGTERIDPAACITTLDGWSEYIRRNVERWWPGFLEAPRPGEESPGKFRMMAIATLLVRQLGVRYNLRFAQGDYDARDCSNLFLHGLLIGAGGTCVTMPVLYIAIARRLGYPVFLVKTRDHYFARWDEPGVERFNVECTCPGFFSPSDEYYCNWPSRVTEADLWHGVLLRNLGRREEFACFLCERGNCLLDHLRIPEALEAYCNAHKILPRDGGIEGKWIAASILYRAFLMAQRGADTKRTRMIAIEEMEYPAPSNDKEAWAIPYAKEILARVLRISGKGDAAARTHSALHRNELPAKTRR